ncbi:RNA polymerase sporulation-specific sigma factor [Ruminococcus sp. YE71]|uniref:sigma-70 family RNA polymerase sigma factor n=1 Tax=unclassified Ruminococcus TaxID=2608920 RepID=UPI00087E36E2|nr:MULTISPECIES: sigma-70 family RNA polymerase sigma factor [unclassified Ruminococcus]SDA29326.1 RNA polymerase sporulation-specific sigma factor [Ruminococcus sp. YE78]SFW48031.1 RNA polymerase sporulation-specific sigma factor [Ruminococcus sp. YE71]
MSLRKKLAEWLTELYRKCVGELDRVDYIGGAEQLPPPLTKEEEQAAFELLKTDRKAACETLTVHNLRLVVYIAKKFESPSCTSEDLVSIGTIGLIKAVRSFDPEKNIKLATYASRCIENEILMYLRKASTRQQDISIDEPLGSDRDGNELLLSDIIGSDEETAAEKMVRECERRTLMEEIERLSDRERQIMELRFGLRGGRELTQKEVADRIGISQSYISRLEKKILKAMRERMEQLC